MGNNLPTTLRRTYQRKPAVTIAAEQADITITGFPYRIWLEFSKKKIIIVMIILVILLGLTMVLKNLDYVFYTTYCKDYYSVIANTWSYYK